jgi:hypothetical protein
VWAFEYAASADLGNALELEVCFLVFALSITTYDVLGLVSVALGLDTVTRLQERVVPYTGWVPSTIRS